MTTALDLTGNGSAGELTTNDFNLYNEAGELKAIGYCYESFGYHRQHQAAGRMPVTLWMRSRTSRSLKAVADDIHCPRR